MIILVDITIVCSRVHILCAVEVVDRSSMDVMRPVPAEVISREIVVA